MERINPEGIRRDQLAFALSRPATVMLARQIDSCLLCRGKGVNEAGLCYICHALIQDPREQGLIVKWLSGEGP